MKRPEDCVDINDIRKEIDEIDRQIIAAIGNRYNYVKAAAKFKTSDASVKAPDRVKAMIEKRRSWATEEGLSPDIIETLFRELVNYFINEELHYQQNC